MGCGKGGGGGGGGEYPYPPIDPPNSYVYGEGIVKTLTTGGGVMMIATT